MAKKSGDLGEQVKAAAAAWIAALDEVIAAAPGLLEGRQESADNLQTILKQWQANAEWLPKRVGTLVEPPEPLEPPDGPEPAEAVSEEGAK